MELEGRPGKEITHLQELHVWPGTGMEHTSARVGIRMWTSVPEDHPAPSPLAHSAPSLACPSPPVHPA